jgi:hypothetical protein
LNWEYQPVSFEEFTPHRAGGVIEAKTIYSFVVYWTGVPFGYNGNRGSAQVFLLLRAPWNFLMKDFVALYDELLKRRMIHDFAPKYCRGQGSSSIQKASLGIARCRNLRLAMAREGIDPDTRIFSPVIQQVVSGSAIGN